MCVHKSKAFTIVEMLVGIAMSVILLLALFELYESTQKIFFNTNSISGAMTQSYNVYTVVQKFLDDGGVGVPSSTSSNGTYPPPSSGYISTSSGTPCDSLTFFGDTKGFGVVMNLASSSANLLSCRLSSTDNSGNTQYYYIIRNGSFYYSSSSNLTPDEVSFVSLSPDNATCIVPPNTLVSATSISANATSANYVYDVTTSQTLSLQSGDALYAVPDQITFFCQANPNDNNNNWLYVETINEATSATNIQPLAPVSSIHYTLYPSGCQSTYTCDMLQTTVAVSSQEKNASGGTTSITFGFNFYK